MSAAATLTTVELDEELSRGAQEEISDARVEWVIADGADWLEAQDPQLRRYDLVFADTWPGKFNHLDEALALVAPGGLYVVDDLVPQSHWPADHRAAVDGLVARLASEPGWHTCRMQLGSGVMVCARTAAAT